ncbi:hypothetical protein SETIT_5G361800v2 [Setaria italica]|uniref:WRKY domain-containing protein n=2 Tax=Setaria TaxID=4554 RepID=K3XPF8_SETIT|nr:WRKY transcription factor WRKY62 [Setaria italica]RCV27896.1 hypothetical protein SETIT_5G361800v2 [Setaria italica]
MAFDPVAKQLSEVLAGGYHRNTQLQALLSRPLDSRGQEVAMEFSQELSRVFAVSMAMLNSNAAAPEVRTGNSFGVSTPVKDQRARSDIGEVVAPSKKEITPSPHKDGYQWRKYGQKKIQNCNFSRYYYRCNRHRRCLAKKKVQQQDGSLLPPMFEVTYVNEHTCHVLRDTDDAAATMAPPGTTSRHRAGAARSSNGGDLFDLFPHVIGGGGGGGGSAEEENDAIVSCLATVVSGAAPSSWWTPAAEATAGDPAAAFVAPAGRPASVDGSVADDGGMMTTMVIDDTGFSSFCPVEEACQHQLVANHHRDVHMDVARLADTVWPQHAGGAWRRA